MTKHTSMIKQNSRLVNAKNVETALNKRKKNR